MHKLYKPYLLNDLALSNRMVMAPMTRRRAENPDLAPGELEAEYYRQRSGAGLIISEGSQVSAQGFGYTNTPGCYTEKQKAGWSLVTNAVHDNDGKIFLQLWHVGALSHRLLQEGGLPPVSASAYKPAGMVLTPQGHKPYETASALTTDEIQHVVDDFGHAARIAREAGFDGVEIHGAHGYLIDQFIMDKVNQREDEFGGSISNRARFLFMVISAVQREWPEGRVGVRLSPSYERSGMGDSQPDKTYGYIVERLNDFPMAYLHLSEMVSPELRAEQEQWSTLKYYRNIYRGTLISCGGYTSQSAQQVVDENLADLIAFGKSYLANPDLDLRLNKGLPLNHPDKETFYHGGRKGYLDYPFAT